MKIPSFPYSGGAIDMGAYTRHIQGVCDELQLDGPTCEKCPELIAINRPLSCEMRFHSVSLNMHRHMCNCKCVYCSLWKQKGGVYSALPGLKSLHEGGFLSDNCFLSWGGGEPSILPEFEEAVAWGASRNYWQHVHTNAIRFSPSILTLLKTGRGEINISLDSGGRDIYRRVKGVDAWAQITKNLHAYSREGNAAAITLKYIVFDANNSIGEIEKFLSLCSSLGIGKVQYSLNFIETRKNAVSGKSILGAAFLRKRAESLGIAADPFFIDEPWLSQIHAASNNF